VGRDEGKAGMAPMDLDTGLRVPGPGILAVSSASCSAKGAGEDAALS
jgi:hypothetical protein